MKNLGKTVNIEEQLDIISRLEKGERVFYVSLNVKYTHISVRTIRDTFDRITEIAKSGPKVFV